MTNVLSAASECVPFVKTGGLADVAGALPGAVAPFGVDMRTLLPGYPQVIKAIGSKPKAVMRFKDLFGGKAAVFEGRIGANVLYVLDAPHLFDRAGAIYLGADGYDWPDNPERYAAFSWVAAKICADGIKSWTPDVLHMHDWQAALAPVYLRAMGADDRVGTLLTIHNIAFQGITSADRLASMQLPQEGFRRDGFEYYGQISALKAGLVYSDRLSTVSPTYAAELMSEHFGMGLDGVLRERRHDLTGILNGIDLDVWSPPFKTLGEKKKLTKALRKEMKLPDSDGPLCVVVSRLTEQKGLDLLLHALGALISNGGQLALLGSGDKRLEHAYLKAADENEHVAVRLGYDEGLAQRLIAGGDVILVPSRFEPCGLTQLYGLRYGTLPLVALTGGLADTIVPANTAGILAGVATGFQFHPIDVAALEQEIEWMCGLYRKPEVWAKMQGNAMRHPVGWDVSASAYSALYEELKKT